MTTGSSQRQLSGSETAYSVPEAGNANSAEMGSDGIDFRCRTCLRGPPLTKKYAKNQCQTCYKKEKRIQKEDQEMMQSTSMAATSAALSYHSRLAIANGYAAQGSSFLPHHVSMGMSGLLQQHDTLGNSLHHSHSSRLGHKRGSHRGMAVPNRHRNDFMVPLSRSESEKPGLGPENENHGGEQQTQVLPLSYNPFVRQ
mmetsp:Transcript_6556/g.8539  ORF Transcript_6556/g.8539 Transcript_6556/m.8539 type:complete len:198 (-) Transcript_6556:557-1150(-)